MIIKVYNISSINIFKNLIAFEFGNGLDSKILSKIYAYDLFRLYIESIIYIPYNIRPLFYISDINYRDTIWLDYVLSNLTLYIN